MPHISVSKALFFDRSISELYYPLITVKNIVHKPWESLSNDS